ALREDSVGPAAERLDAAEQVIPAAGVQAGGVRPEGVEDLVHRKGRMDRLDQNGRPDRSRREPEAILGPSEDVVPEGRFGGRLELRQVEVRGRATSDPFRPVVEQVESGVDEGGAQGRAIEGHVELVEMPAAWPDDELGRPLAAS